MLVKRTEELRFTTSYNPLRAPRCLVSCTRRNNSGVRTILKRSFSTSAKRNKAPHTSPPRPNPSGSKYLSGGEKSYTAGRKRFIYSVAASCKRAFDLRAFASVIPRRLRCDEVSRFHRCAPPLTLQPFQFVISITSHPNTFRMQLRSSNWANEIESYFS